MPENKNVILEVQDLKMKFGKLEVLKGVTTTIRRGEVIVVIGASGAGKSTFLRCLNRLETPTSGDILFEGESVVHAGRNLNHLRERMGMVFQQFNLFNNLNVLNNITLAPIIAEKGGQSRFRRGSDEAAGARGLAGQGQGLSCAALRRSAPARRHRARALAMQPDVMLFDEPTSALDPGDRRRGARRHAAAGRGRHDHGRGFPRDGLSSCRSPTACSLWKTAWSSPSDGTPEEIFERPKSDRLRDFLGKVLPLIADTIKDSVLRCPFLFPYFRLIVGSPLRARSVRGETPLPPAPPSSPPLRGESVADRCVDFGFLSRTFSFSERLSVFSNERKGGRCGGTQRPPFCAGESFLYFTH